MKPENTTSPLPNRFIKKYPRLLGCYALGLCILFPLLDFLYWFSKFPSTYDFFWLFFYFLAGSSLLFAIGLLISMVLPHRGIRFRMMILAVILPLIAIFNYFYLDLAIKPFAERMHFYTLRSTYVKELAKLPNDKGPRQGIFFLSRYGEFAMDADIYIVYDESDEIKFPKQSSEWMSRKAIISGDGNHFHQGKATEISEIWARKESSKEGASYPGYYSIYSLGNHYYVVESYIVS